MHAQPDTTNHPRGPRRSTALHELDAFTQGYLEALFFTECEPGTTAEDHDPETQSSLPGDTTFDDLSPDALEKIVTDCTAFQDANAELLEQAYSCRDGLCGEYDTEQAGRDYWLTRNGHGAGFWDRGLGTIGDALADACRHQEVWVYVGDDGQVYA